MKRIDVKKRALAYLVIMAIAGGVLYLLHSSPVDVKLVLDLTGARKWQGNYLRKAVIKVTPEGEQYRVCKSTFYFPEAVYSSNIPFSTAPVSVRIPKGVYVVEVELYYGKNRVPSVHRKIRLEIKEAGRYSIKASKW